MQRRFLCLYLDTGGGHRAPAKVLESLFKERYTEDEVSVKIMHGFARNNYLARFCFETFYHLSLNIYPAMYSFVYRSSGARTQHIMSRTLDFTTRRDLRRMLEEEQPTDIVIFHFALIKVVKWALQDLKRTPNVSVMVLDPFTPHSSWFMDPSRQHLIYSQRAKDIAVKEYGVASENIHVMPFLLNRKFLVDYSEQRIEELREKYGIPQGKKVVLISGGGEGLSDSLPIVLDFIRRKVDFSVIVVCGRSVTLKKSLDLIAAKETSLDLRVFGFVDNMPELVRVCDCGIIKPGASSVMEFYACRKPVVMSSFIYGQELGNVQFVVDNGIGFFVQKSKKIGQVVSDLLKDEKRLSLIQKNFDCLDVSFDGQRIVDCLMNRGERTI